MLSDDSGGGGRRGTSTHASSIVERVGTAAPPMSVLRRGCAGLVDAMARCVWARELGEGEGAALRAPTCARSPTRPRSLVLRSRTDPRVAKELTLNCEMRMARNLVLDCEMLFRQAGSKVLRRPPLITTEHSRASLTINTALSAHAQGERVSLGRRAGALRRGRRGRTSRLLARREAERAHDARTRAAALELEDAVLHLADGARRGPIEALERLGHGRDHRGRTCERVRKRRQFTDRQ